MRSGPSPKEGYQQVSRTNIESPLNKNSVEISGLWGANKALIVRSIL